VMLGTSVMAFLIFFWKKRKIHWGLKFLSEKRFCSNPLLTGWIITRPQCTNKNIKSQNDQNSEKSKAFLNDPSLDSNGNPEFPVHIQLFQKPRWQTVEFSNLILESWNN
jgi:hypothetical protein